MTPMGFRQALTNAVHGDEIVYHEGFYCIDERTERRIPVAQAAWDAMERGLVVLYQRRLGPYRLQYCAKRVVR